MKRPFDQDNRADSRVDCTGPILLDRDYLTPSTIDLLFRDEAGSYERVIIDVLRSCVATVNNLAFL